MKKLVLLAAAPAFALIGCGDSTDASEDAVADTVEMPADEAMADTPPPVADSESTMMESEDAEPANVTEEEAETAADDAVDAAAAAEAAMAEIEGEADPVD